MNVKSLSVLEFHEVFSKKLHDFDVEMSRKGLYFLGSRGLIRIGGHRMTDTMALEEAAIPRGRRSPAESGRKARLLLLR